MTRVNWVKFAIFYTGMVLSAWFLHGLIMVSFGQTVREAVLLPTNLQPRPLVDLLVLLVILAFFAAWLARKKNEHA